MIQARVSHAVLVCVLAPLCACGDDTPQAPPPPEVEVVAVSLKPVPNLVEFPGRVQATRTAEVRARVDGIVERRLYQEGSDVTAGAPLFAIDPRPLTAALNAAKAALARANANAASASKDLDRYKRLAAKQFASTQQYEAAVTRLQTAQADVAQAAAQVEAANLNLSYADVTAPIAGRAGRAQVTEGALVSGASATLLTTIEQLDAVYVNFSQSSSNLLRVRREIASGILKVPEIRRVVVELVLEDGATYGSPGHMNFFDQSIDQATGTVAMRAEFPNPNRLLLPGQFVRARIHAGERSAVLIPQRAVKITPQGESVTVVGADNLAVARLVTVGDLQAGSWVVLGGLQSGDRVIVDGQEKVRVGEPVRIAKTAPGEPAAAPAP